MKALFKVGIIVVIGGVLLTACEDMLTKAPSDSPSSITFYSNEAELRASINGAYTVFWDLESRSIPLGEELDNSTDIGFLRSGNLKEIAIGGHSPSNSLIVAIWNRLYSGIGKVNNLLDNMHRAEGNVSDDVMIEIQAQAKFLRAYSYHYLVELYGDVPLITSVPALEDAHVPRHPKEDVINQIIEDLDFAANNLPISWSGNNEGRATRGAALALKARVALYNEMYDLAAETAQEVMNSGTYSLYPDYEELFTYAGERNAEVIFDVPYDRGTKGNNIPFRAATRNSGGVATNVPSQFIVDSYIASDGLPIDESNVYDPANPFENRDPRLDASIVRSGTVYAGYVFETHPDSTSTFRIEGSDSVRVSDNHDVTNPFATFTGLHWRKSVPEEDLPEYRQDSSLNWILIRYGEVLLIYAEAKIENGDIDNSVLEALNKIRARGFGVNPNETDQYPQITTTNQNELRRILRNERKVELAHEGFRLFDIRRWRIAEYVMNGQLIGRPIEAYSDIPRAPRIDNETGHPDYEELQDLYRNVEPRSFNPNRDYLWPIPQPEMDANENMTQNPGY